MTQSTKLLIRQNRLRRIKRIYQQELDDYHPCLKRIPTLEPFVIGVRLGKKYDWRIRDRFKHWIRRSGIPYKLEIKRLADWVVGCWYYEPLPDPLDEADHYAAKLQFDKDLRRQIHKYGGLK